MSSMEWKNIYLELITVLFSPEIFLSKKRKIDLTTKEKPGYFGKTATIRGCWGIHEAFFEVRSTQMIFVYLWNLFNPKNTAINYIVLSLFHNQTELFLFSTICFRSLQQTNKIFIGKLLSGNLNVSGGHLLLQQYDPTNVAKWQIFIACLIPAPHNWN